jgi:hypothetical protein
MSYGTSVTIDIPFADAAAHQELGTDHGIGRLAGAPAALAS